MALNLDAIGKKIGPFTRDYTWKDTVLYALGVGAGFSDLDYCYEKNLKVIPSFGITTMYDFMPQLAATSNVNLAGVLHGEQELIFHNPIPSEGTLTTEGAITQYYDNGREKGALVAAEFETFHSNGDKLFTSIVTVYSRLDGGFGGENAPAQEVDFPARNPDFVVEAKPTEDQPLIYRLSGDVFQLHVDQDFAEMAGFEKPIMHGLCTLGYACRALIDSLIPGEPEKVRRLKCRFKRPLYPGIPIKTVIWQTGEGQAQWKVINVETKEVVIDNGIFEYGEFPKTEIRFDGRVAIVTGAGGGLGRIYALELARRGAKVVVNDLGGARNGSGEGSKRPADEVVDEIKALDAEAVANYDSVAAVEGGENIVKTAVDTFGTVDILINNAGILRDKSFLKMEPQDWHIVLDVHLNGAYNVSRPAFAVMKENGYGRILMTTSAAGLYGNFGQTNYTAAKMGLVGLMNTLKLEGEKYNIKVNTIAPVAASRLTEDILPPDLLDKLKPELVAPMALYLVSQQCPVSGNIYNVGMGCVNRAAILTGRGAIVGDCRQIPTPEQIQAQWEKISALKEAKEYQNVTEQVGDLLTALSRPAGSAAESGLVFSTASEVFDAMPGAFVADAGAGVDAIFQYNISGDGGGDWFSTIQNGNCRVEAGTHEKPSCTLKMSNSDFLDLMNGKLPAMQAYTSGKLKIEGDIMKSQLIEKLFRFK
ncbi:MAG: SDR family NAD(P)-dependent oxidoreductase [Deltaproteobacteria bacterium]|jgi:NAD(P)-dependent dehydrogenase (short-subunit alcohol dehydrogenase family)/acyl dehydratase/putative sterol carrier protein|nr:SDR family NAD(P)-dependent oxidoreductase [Deltaproteobacteria bacterium]